MVRKIQRPAPDLLPQMELLFQAAVRESVRKIQPPAPVPPPQVELPIPAAVQRTARKPGRPAPAAAPRPKVVLPIPAGRNLPRNPGQVVAGASTPNPIGQPQAGQPVPGGSPDAGGDGQPGSGAGGIGGGGGGGGGGSGDGGGDGYAYGPPTTLGGFNPGNNPTTTKAARKPLPSPILSRLLGNKDFLITIDCYDDFVTVSPGAMSFRWTAGNAKAADQAFAQAIANLIEHRQASVRTGEPPYRPVICFRVTADGRATCLHVYPLLESLHVPMMRENVID